MNEKRKRVRLQFSDKTWENIRRLKESVQFVLVVVGGTLAVMLFLHALQQPVPSRTGFHFCLAKATSESCVRIPGSSRSDKVRDTPDRLLRYFSNIPERVQGQWRVWIKDVESAVTTEYTVADFYAWMEQVWEARDQDDG